MFDEIALELSNCYFDWSSATRWISYPPSVTRAWISARLQIDRILIQEVLPAQDSSYIALTWN